MIEVVEDYEEDEVRNSIEKLIESNELCSLATADPEGNPHNATAFFAFDENLSLYILSPPDTDHGEHLEENSSIALTIFDSSQEWSDEKQGLQVFGRAELVPDEKASRALEIYLDRFPELEKYCENVEELQDLDSSFYKIETDKIKLFDEPNFGKETWINVEIN